MKLFSKNPLDAAKDNRTALTDRLLTAKKLVDQHVDAVRKLAVEGADDVALDKAEAAVKVARDRVDTLTAAIREVEKTIADLEAESIRLADEKQRAVTVVEIETIG